MAALPARAGTIAVARALPPMLCMLLLGGVPLVDGQSLPGVVDRHEVIVESTRLDIFETVDTRGMTTGRSCNGDRITFREDGTGFTFDEEVQGTFCQAAFLNVSIPGPARTVTVAFTADRVVTNEVQDTPCFPPVPCTNTLSLAQEFQLDFPDGTHRIDPYFASYSGSIAPTAIRREFLMPANASNLTLSWFFQDEGILGTQAPADPGRARLASTVTDIVVTFHEIALPNPLGASTSQVSDEASGYGRMLHWVNATIPPDALGPTRSADLTLEVRRGPTLVQMEGPQAVVPDDRFEASRVGDRIQYTIDRQTVTEQGPGTYSYQFATLVPLPPPPPPSDPSYIYPFYYILALLPLVAAVLALHQANLYVRQAEGTYKRTAWPVFVAVLLVVLYYLLLLGYSYFGIGPERMATLPLEREPLLIYIQFVLLLLMLAGSALAVSRTLIGTMRRDLEDRRRKEDQLRRSNEELERFAYVASHDLQEPLRKVAGFTALLQKRYEGRLDKDADEIIQYAVDGATRMQMLIKDILAYSRVGSKELHRVPVDANATMTLVTSDLGEQIKDNGAQVTWSELPTVRADASQLRQVLQNLVENAVKYRHPKRRPKIEVAAAADGPDWHFTVTDNGQGIPDDKHEEIFGLFRRLHGQGQPGTGIGLAVAKKAVERHGGRIWVASVPGKGSTFHFTLPRSALEGGSTRATPALDPRGAST